MSDGTIQYPHVGKGVMAHSLLLAPVIPFFGELRANTPCLYKSMQYTSCILYWIRTRQREPTRPHLLTAPFNPCFYTCYHKHIAHHFLSSPAPPHQYAWGKTVQKWTWCHQYKTLHMRLDRGGFSLPDVSGHSCQLLYRPSLGKGDQYFILWLEIFFYRSWVLFLVNWFFLHFWLFFHVRFYCIIMFIIFLHFKMSSLASSCSVELLPLSKMYSAPTLIRKELFWCCCHNHCLIPHIMFSRRKRRRKKK